MKMDAMIKRSEFLNNEYQKTKQTIAMLQESLEQAKTQLNAISGHIQELNFIIDQKKSEEAQEKTSKEQEHGETGRKEEELTT